MVVFTLRRQIFCTPNQTMPIHRRCAKPLRTPPAQPASAGGGPPGTRWRRPWTRRPPSLQIVNEHPPTPSPTGRVYVWLRGIVYRFLHVKLTKKSEIWTFWSPFRPGRADGRLPGHFSARMAGSQRGRVPFYRCREDRRAIQGELTPSERHLELSTTIQGCSPGFQVVPCEATLSTANWSYPARFTAVLGWITLWAP
jgi:hypothetical protein